MKTLLLAPLLALLTGMEPIDFNFHSAKLLTVYDGDTIRADIDLVMDVVLHDQPIRLHGINAPELRGPERAQGMKARDHLIELIKGRRITLEIIDHDREKYGRVLAVVWVLGDGRDWCPTNVLCSLNAKMVSDGFAVKYKP